MLGGMARETCMKQQNTKPMILNRITSLVLCLCAALAVTSCGDDDGGSTINSIKMDGDSFKATTPILQGVSLDGEGHIAITFMKASSSSAETLTIDIEYSPDESVSGTYSYPENGTDRLLIEGLTVYNYFADQTMYDTLLQSGTVTVKHHGGDTYTVTMDLTMEDGKRFTGTYKGEFTTQFQNG
jgi:hypothetical protein